jgi:hypothetical protein
MTSLSLLDIHLLEYKKQFALFLIIEALRVIADLPNFSSKITVSRMLSGAARGMNLIISFWWSAKLSRRHAKPCPWPQTRSSMALYWMQFCMGGRQE